MSLEAPSPQDMQRRITALTRALQARTEDNTRLTIQLEEARMTIEALQAEIAELKKAPGVAAHTQHSAQAHAMMSATPTTTTSSSSSSASTGFTGPLAMLSLASAAHNSERTASTAQASAAQARRQHGRKRTRKRTCYRHTNSDASSSPTESDATSSDATSSDDETAHAPTPTTRGSSPSAALMSTPPPNCDAARFEVRQSSLPGSGLGVYTRHNITKGTRIIEYTGERLTYTQYCERYKVDRNGRPTMPCLYVVQAQHGVYIDASARNHANEACLINHVNRTWCLQNCELANTTTPAPDGSKAKRSAIVVIATRDIAAGEELFTHYGAQYWHGMPRNITARRQAIDVLVHDLTERIDEGDTSPTHPEHRALFTALQGTRQRYHERHDRQEQLAAARAQRAAMATPATAPSRRQPARSAHTTPHPAHTPQTPTPTP